MDVIEHGGADRRGGPGRRSTSAGLGPRRHRTLLVLAALVAGTLVMLSVRDGPDASDVSDVSGGSDAAGESLAAEHSADPAPSAAHNGTAVTRLPDLRAEDLPPGTSVLIEATDGAQLLDLHAVSVAPVEAHGQTALAPAPGTGTGTGTDDDLWLTGVRLDVGWSLWRAHADGTDAIPPAALDADRGLAGSVPAGAVVGPRFPQRPTAIEVRDWDTLEVRSRFPRAGIVHDVRGESVVWSACPGLGCPVTVTDVDVGGGLRSVEMPGLALAVRNSLRLSANGDLLAGVVRDLTTAEERYDVVLARVPGTRAGPDKTPARENAGRADDPQEAGDGRPTGRTEVFGAVPVGPSGDPPLLAWTDTGVLVVAGGSDLVLVHDPSSGYSGRVPLPVRMDDGPTLSTPPDGCRNPRRC